MAHFRKRHILERFEKLCAFSPLVGVFGHRQTGKTTFVESHSSVYLSFDDRDTKIKAETDPVRFLNTHSTPRTVLDECQQVPDIFSALKERVRGRKKPGQYILTGSVKFTSRKGIRESLTGRIATTDLLPLTVAEILEKPLPDSLHRLMGARNLLHLDLSPFRTTLFSKERRSFQTYLIQGGLPGICFVRDLKSRTDYLESLLNLILDFDLRQVVDTRLPLRTIRAFLSIIARGALQPYSYAEVKRELGLSEVTQKKILSALESIHVLRRLQIDGSKGDLFLLEDQLEELSLGGQSLAPETRCLTALYRNLRAQFVYKSGEPAEFFQYRTRGGARVPMAVRSEKGTLGFILLRSENPELSEKRSAESLIRKYPEAKVIFLSESLKEARALGVNQAILPLFSLL